METYGYIVTDGTGSELLGWGVTPEQAREDAAFHDYSEPESFDGLPCYPCTRAMARAYDRRGCDAVAFLREGVLMTRKEASAASAT